MMKIILKLLYMLDFWLGVLNLKKHKALKKDIMEELMLVAWNPKRWWNFCMSEDEEKEREPIFTFSAH